MRVAVVADDRLVRRGLVALLVEAGVAVVDADEGSLVELFDTGDIDVALVDGVVDASDGVWVALVEDEIAAASARSSGASGALHREAEGAQLAAALAAVVQGLVVLDPLFVSEERDEGRPQPGFEPLTPRESEVLEHLAMGFSNKEIGGELGISERTARFHVAAILDKLGAQSRTEAVVLAARAGLVVL